MSAAHLRSIISTLSNRSDDFSEAIDGCDLERRHTVLRIRQRCIRAMLQQNLEQKKKKNAKLSLSKFKLCVPKRETGEEDIMHARTSTTASAPADAAMSKGVWPSVEHKSGFARDSNSFFAKGKC